MPKKTLEPGSGRPKPHGKAVIRGSIGPVEDLESYVKADWWRDIFNANYLRTDGDVVEDPDITEAEIVRFDPLKQSFQNINTPEEYKEAACSD